MLRASKKPPTIKHEWRLIALLILILTLLLAACGTVGSSAVTPKLYDYNIVVERKAASEIETLDRLSMLSLKDGETVRKLIWALGEKVPPQLPCNRDASLPDCSAVRTMMADYGTVRNQIRALHGR